MWVDLSVWGSSPLTRGKPRSLGLSSTRSGLIPAHAGKTAASQCTHCAIRAHPRSRGENVFKSGADQMKAGSSPLTRGKPRPPKGSRSKPGLIPAHAGKTTACPAARPAGRAHPRSRGENIPGRTGDDSGPGSSPLTRGKPLDGRCLQRLLGLIPAHAGKTSHDFRCS